MINKSKRVGLQSKMTPQPDCGETSSKGRERLKGYKMLVTE